MCFHHFAKIGLFSMSYTLENNYFALCFCTTVVIFLIPYEIGTLVLSKMFCFLSLLTYASALNSS